MTETFVKERKHAATGKVQQVGIDDAAAVLTRFANGSLGTFESTRYARGHKALYTLEINGEHGSLAWDLHDLTASPGSTTASRAPSAAGRSILVTDGDHPYLGKWWVPGLIIGYEHSFVHTMSPTSSRASSTGKPAGADVPRGAGDDARSATRSSPRANRGPGRRSEKSDGRGGAGNSQPIVFDGYSRRILTGRLPDPAPCRSAVTRASSSG